MSISPANRLSHVQEYYFSHKLKELRKLEALGRPIINLGIGSPDLPPDPSIVKSLCEAAHVDGNHGYQPYQGIEELNKAIVSFYKRHYHVDLSEERAVLPLMGSKEGITHLSLAYLNPGDQVLIPSLGYPTYTSVTKMVEAEPVYFELKESKDWEPDWNQLESMDTSRVKMMWINYPHMPTGTPGSKRLFEKYVAFARERNILLCHDNPYSFVLNDNPLSILSVKGAEEVAVELNSLSKTFNMAGWRIGWMVGSNELIQPAIQIKSNMDSGMFKPMQLAAVEALSLDKDWFEKLNSEYAERRAIVFKILDAWGCEYSTAQQGMFVWAKVPMGSGEQFSDEQLQKHDVFVTPGFIFGSGEQFIRISLCTSQEKLQEVYNRNTQ